MTKGWCSVAASKLECSECGDYYAETEKTCPYCGAKNREYRTPEPEPMPPAPASEPPPPPPKPVNQPGAATVVDALPPPIAAQQDEDHPTVEVPLPATKRSPASIVRLQRTWFILGLMALVCLVVILFLQLQAPPDPRELFEAIDLRDTGRVTMLLNAGVDPTAREPLDGGTPLHNATLPGGKNGGLPEVIKMLLKAGADPNARDAHGNTPLHLLACYQDQYEDWGSSGETHSSGLWTSSKQSAFGYCWRLVQIPLQDLMRWVEPH